MKVMVSGWRALWLACLWLLAQTVTAQTLQDSLVIGQRDDLVKRELSLPAGQYKISIADTFASSPQQLSSAQLFIVAGDKRLASVDLGRLTANFTLTDATAAHLYVAGKPAGNVALLQTRLERTGITEPVLDEPFLFELNDNQPRTYYHEQVIPVNASSAATFELIDFSASGALPLQPFTSILVLISNRDTNGHIRQNLYWDVAAQPGGPALVHTFNPVAGSLFVQIIASAPATGISQVGWELTQNGVELAGDLAQVDDNSSVPGQLIGEFDLAADSTVTAVTTAFSEADPFSLVLASAKGDLLELDNTTLEREQLLRKGHYRVLLLTGEDSEGLIGLHVRAGATQLLNTSASLGDHRVVGELTLNNATNNVDANLHFFLTPAGLSTFELKLVSGQHDPVTLTVGSPTQNGTSLPAGHYRVWEKSSAVSSDGYYRVSLLRAGTSVGQWWGALGDAFVDASSFTVVRAANASLSVLNVKLPDALTESVRVLLTQNNVLLAEYEIDPANATKTIAGVPVPAGDVHLAVLGHQNEDKASVLGYALKIDDTTQEPAPGTPPRGANGSGGGGGGGGSFGSFLLYGLLMLKILRRRSA